jgi:hypothetical protein
MTAARRNCPKQRRRKSPRGVRRGPAGIILESTACGLQFRRPQGAVIPTFIPTTAPNALDARTPPGTKAQVRAHAKDRATRRRRASESYDIFEGTEQIQQLVIARAISGLRIQ